LLVPNITPASEMLRDSELLRSAPVQARSNIRLSALLDSAATIIHKNGYEELTTAYVAKQAGASIGTVYRYFEDRVVLLRSLSTRNFERTVTAFGSALNAAKPRTPAEAVEVLFEAYLSLFRLETGFRSLRLGDVLDIRPVDGVPTSHRSCEMLARRLAIDISLPVTDSNIEILEVAFVMMDALLSRAFALSSEGDPVFIEAARTAVTGATRELR
jgi:AcrR family transcriptional regulator